MRYIIKSVLILCSMGLVLNACKKQENRAIVSTKNASNTLTASAATVVLDSSKKQTNAVTFTWDSVNYNVSAPITYVLVFDNASDAFKNPVFVTAGVSVYTFSYTNDALNTLAIKLMDTLANPYSIQVKVLSYLQAGSNFYDSVYSNAVSLTVTPYVIPKVIPPAAYLYVVGDYMGWAWPPSGANLADSLISPLANGKYAGFVNIVGGTGTDQFKLCKDYTYNNAFADAVVGAIATTGDVSTESMNTAGGTTNNLLVPSNGFYYFQVDTNALTFTGTLVASFSIIGSATGGVAVPLSYNTMTNDWTASGVALTTGNIQFVVNNGDVSSISFGAGSATNQVVQGGPAIAIATAGTYSVILNVSNPNIYTDTLSH